MKLKTDLVTKARIEGAFERAYEEAVGYLGAIDDAVGTDDFSTAIDYTDAAIEELERMRKHLTTLANFSN